MEQERASSGAARTFDRRDAIGLFARAAAVDLEAAYEALPDKPEWQTLRPAQTGLVMVRGRAGGSGARFNLGEATISRCVVALDSGIVGYGQVLGRSTGHARLAALFDALFQDARYGAHVSEQVLAPLSERLAAADRDICQRAAATKVDFFTLARGEDE